MFRGVRLEIIYTHVSFITIEVPFYLLGFIQYDLEQLVATMVHEKQSLQKNVFNSSKITSSSGNAERSSKSTTTKRSVSSDVFDLVDHNSNHFKAAPKSSKRTVKHFVDGFIDDSTVNKSNEVNPKETSSSKTSKSSFLAKSAKQKVSRNPNKHTPVLQQNINIQKKDLQKNRSIGALSQSSRHSSSNKNLRKKSKGLETEFSDIRLPVLPSSQPVHQKNTKVKQSKSSKDSREFKDIQLHQFPDITRHNSLKVSKSQTTPSKRKSTLDYPSSQKRAHHDLFLSSDTFDPLSSRPFTPSTKPCSVKSLAKSQLDPLDYPIIGTPKSLEPSRIHRESDTLMFTPEKSNYITTSESWHDIPALPDYTVQPMPGITQHLLPIISSSAKFTANTSRTISPTQVAHFWTPSPLFSSINTRPRRRSSNLKSKGLAAFIRNSTENFGSRNDMLRKQQKCGHAAGSLRELEMYDYTNSTFSDNSPRGMFKKNSGSSSKRNGKKFEVKPVWKEYSINYAIRINDRVWKVWLDKDAEFDYRLTQNIYTPARSDKKDDRYGFEVLLVKSGNMSPIDLKGDKVFLDDEESVSDANQKPKAGWWQDEELTDQDREMLRGLNEAIERVSVKTQTSKVRIDITTFISVGGMYGYMRWDVIV